MKQTTPDAESDVVHKKPKDALVVFTLRLRQSDLALARAHDVDLRPKIRRYVSWLLASYRSTRKPRTNRKGLHWKINKI